MIEALDARSLILIQCGNIENVIFLQVGFHLFHLYCLEREKYDSVPEAV